MGDLITDTSDVISKQSVITPGPSTNIKHVAPQDLVIFHQNIRSLNNKIDEIWANIESNLPHVLCFTEHHLKSYQLDNIFFKITNSVPNFAGKYIKMVGSAYIFMNLFNFLM
jgi:hypothetical protein